MSEKRRTKIKAERSIGEEFDDRNEHGHGSYGWRTVSREEHEVEIEIIVDYDAIARELGRAAFANKSGKSRDGHVVVKVISSKKLSERKLGAP